MQTILTTIGALLVVVTLTSSQPVKNIDSKRNLSLYNGEPQIGQGEGEALERAKRQYYYRDEIISVPFVYQGFAIWQPNQLKPPYIIPIWGFAIRVPIYEKPPFLPPSVTDTPETDAATTVETDTKFIDESGPVWDTSNSEEIRPTRPTRGPRQRSTTHPPLVHKVASSLPDNVGKSTDSPIRVVSGGKARPSKRQLQIDSPLANEADFPKQPSSNNLNCKPGECELQLFRTVGLSKRIFE